MVQPDAHQEGKPANTDAISVNQIGRDSGNIKIWISPSADDQHAVPTAQTVEVYDKRSFPWPLAEMISHELNRTGKPDFFRIGGEKNQIGSIRNSGWQLRSQGQQDSHA
jgi:hypothetical protein